MGDCALLGHAAIHSPLINRGSSCMRRSHLGYILTALVLSCLISNTWLWRITVVADQSDVTADSFSTEAARSTAAQPSRDPHW